MIVPFLFQAKNAAARDLVTKASTEGLQVQGMQNKQRFTQQFVSEALILSDLFDMDELAAVELLMAGWDHSLAQGFILLSAFSFFFSFFFSVFPFSHFGFLCLSLYLEV